MYIILCRLVYSLSSRSTPFIYMCECMVNYAYIGDHADLVKHGRPGTEAGILVNTLKDAQNIYSITCTCAQPRI